MVDQYANANNVPEMFHLDSGRALQHIKNIVDQDEVPDDDDSEGEADIEYIEAQRDINSEEFAGVSFDVPSFEIDFEFDPAGDGDGEWQVQGGKKKHASYIINCLKNSEPMTKEEVNNVQDIWKLPLVHRWRLYKFWLESYIEKVSKDVFDLQLELRKEFEELLEMRNEEDLYVCQQAHVVGMTTTGAAKYRHIVQHLNPKILIVEEAAEILESHIVTSLAPGTQHVILIGDHQQLRPSPTVHLLAVKYDLNVSLFERMVKNGMGCYRLGIQHRMRPEIASLLVPHIYSELKNHESVIKLDNIKGISKNVFFVTHRFSELQEYDSKSKINQHEAKFLVNLCRYILLQGYEPSQITVLTTYSGQLYFLKKEVGKGLLKGVRFTVVDNYQGEENDIVLISFVRSNDDGEIGFLKISNRICVALSRAKKGLFCTGNFELLAEKSDLWQNIVNTLKKNHAIGPSLQLMCQNHPGVSNVVATEKDFDSVREGGCTRNCEFRLSCGHVCSLMCHPYDKEHEKILCQKTCERKCAEGHRCKMKCFEKCGPCLDLVDKKIESCGHVIKVQCHKRNTNVDCTKPCNKSLHCGHMCSNTCSVKCVVKCRKIVEVNSSVCGHSIKIECSNSEDQENLAKQCSHACSAELSCGHICKGKCSSCRQGRLHISCNQPCKRILVCGHECISPCSRSCPPCKKPCENRCVHSRCPKTCGEPCNKCTEACRWFCKHEKCTVSCGEICNRKPCKQRCENLLNCGHKCIGLCGELCPKQCRICDKEMVEDIFFGDEDEPNARFVCLEDCKHFFEVKGLTAWMKLNNKDNREIQMKTCPRCKTVIRKNLHFGNIVKSCLEEIEKVKKITYGDKEHNMKLQKELLLRIKGDIQSICKPIFQVLMSSKCRSMQEITVMENMINIATDLQKGTTFIDTKNYAEAFDDTAIQHSINKLIFYMKATKKWIVDFIQDEYLTASEQQLQDLTWEVHRLILAGKLLKFVQGRTALQSNPSFTKLMLCIVTYTPFRDSDLKKFSAEYENLARLVGMSVINVSEFEKQSILKAMGLSKGHWYQCPNGHVYCITECGGAVQESNCNECGEKIGGTHHRLVSRNRVATAMDGAQHGAWSEAMNIENYRF